MLVGGLVDGHRVLKVIKRHHRNGGSEEVAGDQLGRAWTVKHRGGSELFRIKRLEDAGGGSASRPDRVFDQLVDAGCLGIEHQLARGRPGRQRDQGVAELLIAIAVHQGSSRRHAGLARIGGDRGPYGAGGKIRIGVGKDESGVAATEFKGRRGEVGGAPFGNAAADGGRTGEDHVIEVMLGEEGRAGFAGGFRPIEFLDGEAGLTGEFEQFLLGAGSVLGRLHGDGVAGNGCLHHLDPQQLNRVVPGGDDGHSAQWRVMKPMLLAEQPPGPTTEASGLENAAGVSGVPGAGGDEGEDFGGDRLVTRLADFLVDEFDELFAGGSHGFPEAACPLAAFVEGLAGLSGNRGHREGSCLGWERHGTLRCLGSGWLFLLHGAEMSVAENTRIAIVGAGPGGLTAAMLLAASGADVTIFEAQDRVGGRSRRIEFEGHGLDCGATFFMMPWALEEITRASGFRLSDLVPMTRLDPMYRLSFRGPLGDLNIDTTQDIERMVAQLETVRPGEGQAFRRFMDENRRKLADMTPILRDAIRSPLDLVNLGALGAMRHIKPWESVYGNLAKRFEDERVRLAMCFQSKYLGMSPFKCPSLFTILPFIEYEYGVWHPEGGVNALLQAIGGACEKLGVDIRLSSPVDSLSFEGRRATGVVVDGEQLDFDQVVINADATWAMRNLIPDHLRPGGWSDAKIEKKGYSCSTWMSYLAVDGEIDLPHHTICFSPDYRRNLDDITANRGVSDEPSMYFCNPSPIDPTVAPPGKSSLYCLLPTANCRADVDWKAETPRLHGEMIDQLHRLGVKDIEKRIIGTRVITPTDWQAQNIHLGATFNIAHNLGQMLHRRPHHRLQGMDGVWMVGGGTHPGSGLPVIFLASQTTARMLCDEVGLSSVLKDHAPLMEGVSSEMGMQV